MTSKSLAAFFCHDMHGGFVTIGDVSSLWHFKIWEVKRDNWNNCNEWDVYGFGNSGVCFERNTKGAVVWYMDVLWWMDVASLK